MQRGTEQLLNVLENTWLLFLITFILCLLMEFKRAKESCERLASFECIIYHVITAVMNATISIATALLLPIFLPINLPYESKVGIILYLSVFGVERFQGLVYRKLGLSPEKPKEEGRIN